MESYEEDTSHVTMYNQSGIAIWFPEPCEWRDRFQWILFSFSELLQYWADINVSICIW